MKKSLLALAVLGAFAGAASAQSSVTLYGRVDLSVGKNSGAKNKVMQNGSGSRMGLRGSEDLGGGLSAIFNIEHRFDADTGAQSNGAITAGNFNNAAPLGRFWNARSFVGLKGGFGQVVLGREYTTSFLYSQLTTDPWGADTVVESTGTSGIIRLGIGKVRMDSALTYSFAASGFSFAAQTAERTDTIAKLQKRPVNAVVGYSAGPVSFNVAHERTGEVGTAAAKITNVAGAFDLGAVKLGASYAKGTTTDNKDAKGFLLTAVAPLGQGEFRAAIGQRKVDGVKDISLLGLGYHYALSKRTTVYADFARNSKLAAEKTGYDFGIKHNF